MKNPNDMAADYYDKVYHSHLEDRMTKNDIKIIKKQIKKGSLLDVGCGTGRHLIPLLMSGYRVTGVDTSSGMLKVLKRKLKDNTLKAKVINQDIRKFKSKKTFNGIILFWNAFNEIAVSEKEARKVANVFYNLLNKEGKVILDFSISPPKGGLSKYVLKDGNMLYKIVFRNSYNKKTGISKDSEVLEVFSDGKRIKYGKVHYIHRWWKKNKIKKIFVEAGFTSISFSNSRNKMILMIAKK